LWTTLWPRRILEFGFGGVYWWKEIAAVLAAGFDVIWVENLQLKAMTRSPWGTVDKPAGQAVARRAGWGDLSSGLVVGVLTGAGGTWVVEKVRVAYTLVTYFGYKHRIGES
jgi:hypothetical protein